MTTKELITVAVSAIAIGGTIFAAGQRVGDLNRTIVMQGQQLASLTTKVDSLTLDLNGTRLELMRVLSSHLTTTDGRRGR